MKRVAFLVVALMASLPAISHHSISMYDLTNLIVLDGTVKAMQWRNPHVTVEFVNDATPSQPARSWIAEVSSPGVMTRSGWTKRSLNPGDRVQVQLAPLRDGKPGGALRRVTLLATGQVLTFSIQDSEKAGLD